MALDRFITLSEAAQRMRTSVKETRSMIKSGKIKGGLLPDGAMVVSEDTIPKRKEDLPEYKQYKELKGIGISASEAARNYHVPHQNFLRWAQSGIIKTNGWSGNKRLLDEQDVAYCAEIYLKARTQGRRLFNPDGTPFPPKSNSASK